MAKYSIEDTTMAGLANSARGLTGGTAGLTPSGIKAVLDKEKSNVTAALAAIAEKGVTVDSGSNSDDLAALIASIEAGGGGGRVVTGTMVPASETAWNTAVTIGGIGFRPSYVFIVPKSNTYVNTSTNLKEYFIYAYTFIDPAYSNGYGGFYGYIYLTSKMYYYTAFQPDTGGGDITLTDDGFALKVLHNAMTGGYTYYAFE